MLCKSLRDTSSRLAELGWLHNKVRKYTDARSLDRAFGLVGQVCFCVFALPWILCCFFNVVFCFVFLTSNIQKCLFFIPQSFCASLHQELKEYYRLLSVLHSQVQTTFYDWTVNSDSKTRWRVLQISNLQNHSFGERFTVYIWAKLYSIGAAAAGGRRPGHEHVPRK